MVICNTDEMEGILDLSFDIRFEKIVISTYPVIKTFVCFWLCVWQANLIYTFLLITWKLWYNSNFLYIIVENEGCIKTLGYSW